MKYENYPEDVKLDESELDEAEWKVKELNHRLQSGRNYLMSVKPSELTAQDALEAFGFSRDGGMK